MYKILLVDDEPRHRRGLTSMIKELKPDYEIFEAKNGEEGLEFLLTNHIDIVITDIKMPIMNGLEMVEQLGEKLKGIKVIILSVYDNFEYARKAIKLDVFDYVLKPVDESKIHNVLERVENKIQCEQKELLEKKGLLTRLNKTLPVYIQHQLNKWINGQLDANEVIEIENIFPYKGRGVVLITKVCKCYAFNYSCNKDEIGEIQQNIKYWMKLCLDSFGHSISFFLTEKSNIMVTILNTSGDINLKILENNRIIDEYLKGLQKEYGFSAIIGVGSIHENIFESIKESYINAEKALSTRFFQHNESVIIYEKISGKNKSIAAVKLKEEKRLTEAIIAFDTTLTGKVLAEIFNSMIAPEYPDVNYFKETSIAFILNQVKIINSIMPINEYELMEKNVYVWLNDCDSFSAFQDASFKIINDLINGLKDRKNTQNEFIMKKCIRYIEEHYMEELSLDTFAQMFRFNSSYFSNYFKNYTGVCYSEYLLGIRLEKAKELLTNSDLKVYEVSDKVGYKDPKYFNRLFKKKYGISPDVYRHMNNAVGCNNGFYN